MEIFGVLGFVLLIAGIVGAKSLTNLIYVSGPNEVLVFSGLKHRSGNRSLGYKLIKGGRGIRVPLFEVVDKLELTNMIIDITVSGAYSKGGIPLNVQAVANIKIAGDEPVIHNAIERLLGKPRAEIMKIAKETLEGNLRGVLATLTPEQVNEDKMAFAQSLLHEAEHDLHQLGIVLDTLKIQNVTDDQGYLSAIGRRQSAELHKRASIAEADARATAAITAAENLKLTSLAQLDARTEIARAEAQRRVIDAQTKRQAVVAEQEAEVFSLVTKASAELDVQKARIEQVRRQLQAEIVEQASARRDTMVYEAQGHSARIIEDGKARAEALRAITAVWTEHGEGARQALLFQKLDAISDILTGAIAPIRVDNLTMIDSAASRTAESGTLPMRAISTIEQVRRTTGVDLGEVAQAVAGNAGRKNQ